MRSMVSRGVQSLAGVHSGTEEPSRTPATHLTVDSVDFFRPGDEGYIFPRESFSYHLVRSIRDLTSGQVLTPIQILQRYGKSDFIAVQRPADDGFEKRIGILHPRSCFGDDRLGIGGACCRFSTFGCVGHTTVCALAHARQETSVSFEIGLSRR